MFTKNDLQHLANIVKKVRGGRLSNPVIISGSKEMHKALELCFSDFVGWLMRFNLKTHVTSEVPQHAFHMCCGEGIEHENPPVVKALIKKSNLTDITVTIDPRYPETKSAFTYFLTPKEEEWVRDYMASMGDNFKNGVLVMSGIRPPLMPITLWDHLG